MARFSGKIRIFFLSQIHTKPLAIVTLVILVAAIPLTVYISQKRQEIRQHATELSDVDLDVTYVARTPRYNYDDIKGWPSDNEIVTFTAHIRNMGSSSTPFNYAWFIDGNKVNEGVQTSVAPNTEVTQTYRWQWISGNHKVKFVADPENSIAEKTKTNNSLEDYTNAIIVGFWVEKSVYDYFDTHQFTYCADKSCAGSNSWEDWAQRQIRKWNEMLTTYGGISRVRLDKITIVNDCTLPLHGGFATNNPDLSDKSVDAMWGFTSSAVGDGVSPIFCPRDQADGNKNFYFNHPELQDIEAPLIHELNHARYLIHPPVIQPQYVHILDDQGNPISSSVMNNTTHFSKYADIMTDSRNPVYSALSIGALNRIAGKRNKGGNFNAPSSYGEYVYDLPQTNYLKIVDVSGAPIKNALISIYQAINKDVGFDNVPHIVGVTDENGLINVGKNPFGDNLLVDIIDSVSDEVIVKIKSGQESDYQFVEVGDFNLAYWSGQTTSATHTISTRLNSHNTSPSPLPSQVTPTVTITTRGTQFALTLKLGGIGGVGENQNPITTPRTVIVQAVDSAGNNVGSPATGTVTYKSSGIQVGLFTGTINMEQVLADGSYRLRIKTDRYLWKLVPEIQTIAANVTIPISLPQINLIPGDINGDNKIDIADYNIILSCFENRAHTPSCGMKKTIADLDDDGIVDGVDYNIFIRSFIVQQGK